MATDYYADLPLLTSKQTKQMLSFTNFIIQLLFFQIYVDAKMVEQCIHVRKNDRVGIFFEEIPSAIPYIFNAKNPTALTSKLTNLTAFNEHGDVVQFDTLNFPYDLLPPMLTQDLAAMLTTMLTSRIAWD